MKSKMTYDTKNAQYNYEIMICFPESENVCVRCTTVIGFNIYSHLPINIEMCTCLCNTPRSLSLKKSSTYVPAASDASVMSFKDSRRYVQESSTTASSRWEGTWINAFRTDWSLIEPSSGPVSLSA